MTYILDYESYDATALAELVANKEVTPEELLDTALERARLLNPHLNALTNLKPDTARRLISDGLPQGPMRGVPFLLKDLGAEAIDFPSHNGSELLRDTKYSRNSALYDRLAATGLVTFGRTTAPEGGIGPVTEACVYGGPTRNPWNPARTSGGSSGGAGAAVAAGIVPVAHGSDGGGSIRIPASSCGLFGFKATRGRLPDGPFVGEGWAGMAIDGFLSRSVRDTAALLDATQGPDAGAPYRAPPLHGTYLDAVARKSARLRIGFATTTLLGEPIHPDCRQAVEAAATLLESLGHHVEPALPKVCINDMNAAWTLIVACGTSLWVSKATAARGRPLADGELEPVALAACAYAATLSGELYLDAINRIHQFGRDMAPFFEQYDILLTSTLAEPPAEVGRFAHVSDDFLDYRIGEKGVFDYSPFTAAFNATGQPAASVPLHWNNAGLPVGIQLAAGFGEDETLMSLCGELEAAQPWFARRPAMSSLS